MYSWPRGTILTPEGTEKNHEKFQSGYPNALIEITSC
jgi:hypothetical protein